LEVAGEHKLIVQPTVALFRLFILLSSKLTPFRMSSRNEEEIHTFYPYICWKWAKFPIENKAFCNFPNQPSCQKSAYANSSHYWINSNEK
jgi:hypothetical protein